ncbi:antiviral reverse transcriptase Drt3b [Rhizosaccharibacter radicis]|uniref:RNA-directed DNA polymerase n=1 Tax=Rhizosaccharibacter radicis TaxID=2782605 RepID=A0ABT1VVX0_9PROT|nr:RNA-directed DNA polymerase [Acetobacteraceae bacterium KSS12]
MRVIVTDTTPEEVPIIFSNDGFYRNRTKYPVDNKHAQEFFTAILKPEHSYTKPYRYNILKDPRSARSLSLIHPSAQESVARFYHEYDSLICHFASKSLASLRAPQKVGTTFFVQGSRSSKNKFRGSGVDTVTLETTLSNPSSYFSYNKIRRAHEFFESNDYVHLEKKFQLFRMLDVSKCFSSIYTHSLYWAVADIKTAKNNISSAGFANEFDRLMQSMNYNETNGICIGPEVSRIFAELIFADIDAKIVKSMFDRSLKFKVDYEFRRYVDDYYLFAADAGVLDVLSGATQVCLGKFKLHVNHEKTSTLHRPFVTQKSQIVADADGTLSDFFEKFLTVSPDKNSLLTPKFIKRSDALMRSIIKKVKATCMLHDVGYEAVSDYIISALTRRICNLSDGVAEDRILGDDEKDRYVSAYVLLVEVLYFFYTVNPTVRSSLNVAKSIVVACRFFKQKIPERLPILSENIVRWTIDLSRAIARADRHKDLTAVPLEVLNVLVPMREIVSDEPLVDDLIEAEARSYDSFDYFEVVSFLFMSGGRVRHRDMIAKLFARAKSVVDESLGPRTDSDAAHLCLDLLACPFLSLEKRASWFNSLRSKCGISQISRLEAQLAVAAMQNHPWFVRWDQVDLLRLLKKKELSPIY